MADKKSRTKLSVEDKMAMFAYKEEHPNASFTKIAEIFTEKLNKKIHRTMALKNCGWPIRQSSHKYKKK